MGCSYEEVYTMIEVFVVRNEQLPYTEGELGFPTAAMPTKKDSGVRQTGDYYVEIGGVVMPTVFERKSLQDFYGSTIPEKNRARLYAEIERFGTDEVKGIELGECYVFPKIDGTNASIWADPAGPMGCGSRKRKLSILSRTPW